MFDFNDNMFKPIVGARLIREEAEGQGKDITNGILSGPELKPTFAKETKITPCVGGGSPKINSKEREQ